MIKTELLTKKYANDFVALDSLNLEIDQGEVFGYIGPNGAGKTTTIRMLCAMLKPSGGKAFVDGNDVTRKVRLVRTLTGYLPDSFGVYEEMRVWEYLDFFGACFKIPKKKRKQQIDAVLDITGSTAMRDYFVDTLSHGMKQRIGIAKTLMHDPKVMFLDEPTNGLDPRARIEMRQLIRKLAELGKTILVSSHILPELSSICDRVGIIERGQLLAQGTVAEIMQEVRPHRLIEVRFGNDPQVVRTLAEELEDAGDIHSAVVTGDILQFEVTGGESKAAALLRYLVENNVDVCSFDEKEADLEEAFMKVTDNAAAGSRAEADAVEP
jgi:ABC-2 type transport system ATP-binding protein